MWALFALRMAVCQANGVVVKRDIFQAQNGTLAKVTSLATIAGIQ